MPFFNPAPSQDQLLGMTYRNLAAEQVKRPFFNDDLAYKTLQNGPSVGENAVLGFSGLFDAAQSYIMNAGDLSQMRGLATIDTDGVLIPCTKEQYNNHFEAIKAPLIPTLFPWKGRLESAMDKRGLSEMENCLKDGLMHLLGVSISSQHFPRQGMIKDSYQEIGSDYICGLPRNLAPEYEDGKRGGLKSWNDFMDLIKKFGENFESGNLTYAHTFDILPPVRIMAYNNGQEGIFARVVTNLLNNIGLTASPVLVEINPFFPKGGVVMGNDLTFRPLLQNGEK